MTEEQPANYYVAFQRGMEIVLIEIFEEYDSALKSMRELRRILDHLSMILPESWEDIACSFRQGSKSLRIIKVEVVYS